MIGVCYRRKLLQRLLLHLGDSLGVAFVSAFHANATNDLPDGLTLHCLIFSDNTSLSWKPINNTKLTLIKIWSWLADEHISGKCFLILELPRKLQKFASHINVIMFRESLWLLTTIKYNPHLLKNILDLLILNFKLDFNQHIDGKINKWRRIIGIMKRFSMTLSRKRLLAIYKCFVIPLLDYANIIYNKP